MDFVPLLATLTLIYTLVNLFKEAQAGNWRHVATQTFSMAVAVLLVLLLGSTDFGDTVVIGEWVLGELDVGSRMLFGLSVGSGANVIYDALPKNTPTLGEEGTSQTR